MDDLASEDGTAGSTSSVMLLGVGWGGTGKPVGERSPVNPFAFPVRREMHALKGEGGTEPYHSVLLNPRAAKQRSDAPTAGEVT
jgi:hypothetical protein